MQDSRQNLDDAAFPVDRAMNDWLAEDVMRHALRSAKLTPQDFRMQLRDLAVRLRDRKPG